MDIFEWDENIPVTANNLNEMQNILNNNISENVLDKYSTDETIIGEWINGEPIYRRAFYGRTSSSFYVTTLTNELSGRNILLVNCGGTLTQPGNDNFRMNIGGFINNNWYSAIYLSNDDVSLYYAENLKNGDFIAFIDYIYI